MNNSLIFKNENLGEIRVIFIDNESYGRINIYSTEILKQIFKLPKGE